jgi:hypothetical protein
MLLFIAQLQACLTLLCPHPISKLMQILVGSRVFGVEANLTGQLNVSLFLVHVSLVWG